MRYLKNRNTFLFVVVFLMTISVMKFDYVSAQGNVPILV